VNVKDALDLVKDEIERKWFDLKKAASENFVALNIVDKGPELSADLFIEASLFAKDKGVKVQVAMDINKSRRGPLHGRFKSPIRKRMYRRRSGVMTKTTKTSEREAHRRECHRFITATFGNKRTTIMNKN